MSERKVFDSEDECYKKIGLTVYSDLPICYNCKHVRYDNGGKRCCINAVNIGYNNDDAEDITSNIWVVSNTGCDRFEKRKQ